jgi:hypothetical protein
MGSRAKLAAFGCLVDSIEQFPFVVSIDLCVHRAFVSGLLAQIASLGFHLGPVVRADIAVITALEKPQEREDGDCGAHIGQRLSKRLRDREAGE